MASNTKIFRASCSDWESIEADRGFSYTVRCMRELRDRVAALEAARQAEVELLNKARAQQPAAEPSDEELWAIRLQALAQEGPGGGWAPWRPRENVTVWGVAQICANRALFNAGVAHATARAAQQQTTTEDSSAPQPASASPDTPQSLHRAIREPMVAPGTGSVTNCDLFYAWREPARLSPLRVGQKWRRFDGKTTYVMSPTDGTSGYAFVCRASNDEGDLTYTANGKYINDCLPHGETVYDLAELIEDAPEPAPAEPAPPAPAGGLVEEIRNRLGHYGDRYYGDSYVREAIKTTAAWLLQHCDSPDGLPSRWLIDSIAQILREEATR